MKDPESDKLTRADAILINLPSDIKEEIWNLRVKKNPKDKIYTLLQVQKWIKARLDLDVKSLTTIGDFYRLYPLEMGLRYARDAADKAREEMMQVPDASLDAVNKASQLVFSTKALEAVGTKQFGTYAKAANQRAALAQEDKKMQRLQQTKIEAGLEALYEEAKGDPRAKELVDELAKIVKNKCQAQ